MRHDRHVFNAFIGTVSASEVSRMFDLTNSQTEVLLEVLAALSLSNNPLPLGGGGSASSPQQQPGTSTSMGASMQPVPLIGQERIYLHVLSMFLLAQVFAHTTRSRG